MTKDIKLAVNSGVELKPVSSCVAHAKVIDRTKRFELSWDRFIRLHNTALAITESVSEGTEILDVGGFDGALAMFLPSHTVYVVDPITTGGSGHNLPDAYDAIVSIDALEHVVPMERHCFLEQLSKASKKHCFINFPAKETAKAQQLVYELTNNPLVKEHVEWGLPDREEVKRQLESSGFEVETRGYASVAQWISQYLLQTVSPELAAQANKFLIEEHLTEPVGIWLYDLLIALKRK